MHANGCYVKLETRSPTVVGSPVLGATLRMHTKSDSRLELSPPTSMKRDTLVVLALGAISIAFLFVVVWLSGD